MSRLRGPSPTRLGALATAVVLALAGPLVAPPLAQANLAGSTFEGGDGNLTVDTQGGTDWANVGDVHTGVDRPSGSSFEGGTVEDDPSASVVTGPVRTCRLRSSTFPFMETPPAFNAVVE